MPNVSGLIVHKLCHRHHDGNIICLEPVAPSANYHDYGSGEYKEPQDEKEPEEPLGIMPKVAAVILLIAVHGFLALFD